MEVRVEYEYTAQEPDELTLKKGDILTNVIQKLDGWWEGNLGSKRGLFPDNFVKVITSDPDSEKEDDVFNDGVQLRKKPTSRKLKALFSYTPEQEDELALNVGDILDFISEVEDGWYKGILEGKTGIFPSNFVSDFEAETTNGTSQDFSNVSHSQNVKNRGTYIKNKGVPDVISVNSKDRSSGDLEPAPKLPPKPPAPELARCFYPYPAQNEDELELNEGDIVKIISKNCEDEGWWRGELRGKTGLFPDNFVRLITSSDQQSTATSGTAVPQQKMLAQGRNTVGILGGGDSVASVKKALPSPTTESTTSVVDGATGSKSKVDRDYNLTGNRKVSQIKEELKDLPIGLPPQKPITPTSPISPATGGFSYLSNVTLKSTGKKDAVPKKEQPEEPLPSEVGDFNSVERGEKLSHLTATRAKAPKRRPPSAVLSRESDNGIVNGMDATLESSADSPHQNGSSLNHNGGSPISLNTTNTGVSNSTASTALVSDGSNLSTPGSRLSYSRDNDNTSASSLNANSTPTGAKPVPAKPAKLLPWMVELKQTQDKKRQNTSPNPPTTNAVTNSPVTGLTTSTTPNAASTTSASPSSSPTPLFSSTPTSTTGKEKESGLTSNNFPPATKAPPLPAKPIIPAEKISSSATSNSVAANTTPANTPSSVSSISLKLAGRKTPTTLPPSSSTGNYINTVVSPATPSNSSVVNNGSISHTVTTPNSVSNNIHTTPDAVNDTSIQKRNANKPEFVSYEEHAKLRDRVYFLESELEAVKKQLKLLLDRDSASGHMV